MFPQPSRMLKNPSSLSFRGAAGNEKSPKSFVCRARFLAQFTLNGQGEIPRFAPDRPVQGFARNDSEGLGMTMFAKVFSILLEN